MLIGNVAATADQETLVLLTFEGVRLATYGGQIWACGACTKPRGIGEADLIPGAKTVTAANVVEYLASGASSLSF